MNTQQFVGYFYIYIRVINYLGKIMKLSEFKGALRKRNINEGIIDKIASFIAKKRADRQMADDIQAYKKSKQKLKDDYIEFYGSYDKIPNNIKKVLEK